MGRDNQDYFKRGGRSGGPPGPLHQFRDQMGRQHAALSRGGERGFPGSRPQPGPPRRRPTPEEEEAVRARGEDRAELGSAAGGGDGPAAEGSAATRESREEHAGSSASEASFGPPASEEYAEGYDGAGVQRTNGASLPAPLEGMVRRFPRLSRALARMARAQAVPARKFADLGERIESTLGSGRR